jgi:signal transduction histidine kinase
MRPRPSTVALAAVIVFMLAGLTAAERALSAADETHVRNDAVETAARVEGFLAVHAAALSAFHGLVGTPAADTARFDALVAAARAHAPAFRHVWVTDAAGRIVHDAVLGADGRPGAAARSGSGPLGPASVAALAGAAARARRTRVLPVATLPSIGRGVAIVEPLFVGDSLVGVVGGVIPNAAFSARLPGRSPDEETWATILAGADTLVADTAGVVDDDAPGANAIVPLPGGGEWSVTVVHGVGRRGMRVLLWATGLGVLLVLTVGLMHERRQARRIAERSSELERLSDELLRANRAKSEFLANVSHELRTPLNAIVGFADLLRDGVYGELTPRQSGPVQRIEASATHLRHLVDQVLDLAKIAAGRLEVHPEPIALRPFVIDVASEVESLVNERGLSLSIGVGASLPRVRTDPTHLRQILVNLLGNAVKYTVSGGVAVRARLVGPPSLLPRPTRTTGDSGAHIVGRAPDPGAIWIALQVVDTGVGIAPADQERIFDEFEQVNAGPRGDSMRRGTGLGLSISRRLARLLGGDITVESELGRGSSFTLWLPVSTADVKQKEELAAARA